MRNIKLQKIVGNFLDKLRKIVHEWNDHLEILPLSQDIEILVKLFLLRTDISQNTIVGCLRIKAVIFILVPRVSGSSLKFSKQHRKITYLYLYLI